MIQTTFLKKQNQESQEFIWNSHLFIIYLHKSTMKTKRSFFVLSLLFTILIIVNLATTIDAKSFEESKTCGDGTFQNTCSLTKPFFCLDRILIESSSTCGCPDGFIKKENLCLSNLQKESKRISLKYVLKGQENSIEFTTYNEVTNHLSSISRTIVYSGDEISSRADFKLKSINEEIQRDFLLPLVIAIQNSAKSKEDQARIAISIVQNIPFGGSNKTINFGEQSVDYFRHPYEILSERQGVCGEKVELLAFLLREIGYGTAFFYFPKENHEALGIKCPVKKSLEKSGYCFVETTSPSIITEKEINYVGIGKLSSSFQIFLISDGISLEKNLYEYKDAKRMNRIRKSFEKRDGRLNFFLYFLKKNLNKKYGLDNGKFNP